MQVADVIFDVSNELMLSSLPAMATYCCLDIDSGQHGVTNHAAGSHPGCGVAAVTYRRERARRACDAAPVAEHRFQEFRSVEDKKIKAPDYHNYQVVS